MRLKKFFLFIFILPVTLVLDFMLFSLTRACPSCGSFSQFLASEAALSFPLVVSFSEWVNNLIVDWQIVNKKEKN